MQRREVDLTVWATLEGDDYKRFLPKWWNAVQALDPKPREIVLCVHQRHESFVRHVIGDDATIVTLDEPFSVRYFNHALEHVTSKWAGYCSLDDLLYPNAYQDLLNYSGTAEIMVGTIVLSSGPTWHGAWDIEQLKRINTVPGHSPVKKSLYDRIGGWVDMRWSDWAFWLKAARAGVEVFHSSTPICVFDVGADRPTVSGLLVDPHVRAQADAEVHAFAQQLWSK